MVINLDSNVTSKMSMSGIRLSKVVNFPQGTLDIFIGMQKVGLMIYSFEILFESTLSLQARKRRMEMNFGCGVSP